MLEKFTKSFFEWLVNFTKKVFPSVRFLPPALSQAVEIDKFSVFSKVGTHLAYLLGKCFGAGNLRRAEKKQQTVSFKNGEIFND